MKSKNIGSYKKFYEFQKIENELKPKYFITDFEHALVRSI